MRHIIDHLNTQVMLKQINFRLGDVIHCIDIKPSATPKLAQKGEIILQTYHFSIDQVNEGSLKNDSKVCFDCKFSYNANGGKSGGCYTHANGSLAWGLIAKVKSLKKRLDKGLIPEGTEGVMEQITSVTKKVKISFARMGTYGEPTLLPFELLEQIRPLVGKVSGYTHQWHKPENKQYAKYLMASTHNIFDVKLAEGLGFRSYNASEVEGAILCPSAPTIAKEKQVSCAKCGLCEGGKKAKNIYNVIH